VADEGHLTLTAPQPLQVMQRTSLTPGLGSAVVSVTGTGAPATARRAEVRTQLCHDATGAATAWTAGDLVVDGTGAFTTAVRVAAGGWFTLDVRLLDDGGAVVADGAVEPVGIGEVFVVAGQSYSVSCHEKVMTIQDPTVRAVAATPEDPAWRFAHDPQPGVRTRLGAEVLTDLATLVAQLDLRFPLGAHSPYVGSLWPPFADAMIETTRVPVGLVNVGVGATEIRHWKPGGQLFANLCDAVALAGDYRAVLWQQGESDVMLGTPTDVYAAALVELRTALVEGTGLDRPWLPAKSTHHPSDNGTSAGGAREEQEEVIRAAVDRVCEQSGFFAGPDTDLLRGPDYRAGWFRGSHFTAKGQRSAGLMWATRVNHLLQMSSR
jgi:hypothetical protein